MCRVWSGSGIELSLSQGGLGSWHIWMCRIHRLLRRMRYPNSVECQMDRSRHKQVVHLGDRRVWVEGLGVVGM